jgi:peptidoglycan/xylan/chitin deacetylase (PgdA/CDA1 family)
MPPLKGVTRRAAASALKSASAVADVVRRPPPGVVILLYHQVGAPIGSEVNLPPDRFAQQLDHLADRGVVIALDEAVDALSPGAGPADAVSSAPTFVVTFDDGTADFVDNALPALVERRVPVTLYVATKWVEEQQSFWNDGTLLSWTALAEALSTGLVTIGSHTHSHVLLDRLDPLSIADELDRSIELIGERLGVVAEHFAYPKALPPAPEADLAVRERFRSAALAGTRPNRRGATDPFKLARTPVQVSDGVVWFRRKAAGGMRLEDDVRGVVNRRRYARASS